MLGALEPGDGCGSGAPFCAHAPGGGFASRPGVAPQESRALYAIGQRRAGGTGVGEVLASEHVLGMRKRNSAEGWGAAAVEEAVCRAEVVGRALPFFPRRHRPGRSRAAVYGGGEGRRPTDGERKEEPAVDRHGGWL